MKIIRKQIMICGFSIDVVIYDNATYLYPSFNGNAEFRANHKEFRKLSHYLRTIKWMQALILKTIPL
ncbi:MAG: hypothetical protein RL621_1886 [Bacteroidota bacterium]|jgi:hypothetical protein